MEDGNRRRSGDCGTDLTWEIDGTTLTISGTGRMYSYAADPRDDMDDPPWEEEPLESILIQDGVTSIGRAAFSGLGKVKEVQIAESVEEIHYDAFAGCTALEKVRLPEGLTTIDAYAFAACISLKSIRIPDSVKKIGSCAFSHCTSLSDVRFPENALLEPRVFEYTPWMKKQPPFWILGTTLYQYNDQVDGHADEVIIPAGITEIGNSAFLGNAEVTKVVVPEGVKIIRNGAFRFCKNLEEIVLPDSLREIGENAFRECRSLKRAVLPEGVSTIERWAFYQAGIEEVYIPRNLKVIRQGIFDSCGSLRDVYYAGSKEEWSSVRIDNNNRYLLKAAMHFGSPA